jgi:hypothetical protein
MKDHVKVIGILWIIIGAFCLCLGALALLVFFGVALIPNVEDMSPNTLRLIGVIAASLLGFIGLPQVIGGWGLIKHKEWARILMLVVSFLNLFHIPFGTALAIYSMIILFNPETVRLFQAGIPAPPAAKPTS